MSQRSTPTAAAVAQQVPRSRAVSVRSTSTLGIGLLASLLSVCGTVRADVITDWNQAALNAANVARYGGPAETRLLAMVHAAMYDAVNSIDRRHEAYAVDVKAAAGASMEAAAVAAAHGILVRALPTQKSMLDSERSKSLSGIPEGHVRDSGIAVGEQVAEKLFALRKDDGSNRKVEYVFGSGPGIYQRTPPGFAAPVANQWRFVKPFMLLNAKQFDVPPPPAIASDRFARDFEEVREFGSKNSTARTSQQTASAVFWVQSEMIPFSAAARSAAAGHNNNLVDNARLFALFSMAAADAIIAGYEVKYTHSFWRPITAIRAGAVAFNSKLSADPGWEPLITTPPHPDYPSAHCLASGAMEMVLRSFFASDKVDVTVVFPAPGILRHYTSFSQIAQEVVDARVWSGIHYRSADEQGLELGHKVAQYGMTHLLRPVQTGAEASGRLHAELALPTEARTGQLNSYQPARR
jgi:hypothetical protein